MIPALVRELLLPLLGFLLLRTLLRGFFSGLRRNPAKPSQPPPQNVEVLKKDPCCGTYVSPSASVTRVIHGEVVHFCSKECAAKYAP
jgi:YHS domain-containing protein